jgi:hypothetical protein
VAVAAVLVRRAGLPGADVGLNKKGNIVFFKKNVLFLLSVFWFGSESGSGQDWQRAESREQRGWA